MLTKSEHVMTSCQLLVNQSNWPVPAFSTNRLKPYSSEINQNIGNGKSSNGLPPAFIQDFQHFPPVSDKTLNCQFMQGEESTLPLSSWFKLYHDLCVKVYIKNSLSRATILFFQWSVMTLAHCPRQ